MNGKWQSTKCGLAGEVIDASQAVTIEVEKN